MIAFWENGCAGSPKGEQVKSRAILATATIINGALVGLHMPRPAFTQNLAPKSFVEYTVVLDEHITLKDGSVRTLQTQTFAQRADGTRVEVSERQLKYGKIRARRVFPLAGGSTVISDTLNIKAVRSSPSSDPAFAWAGRLSPQSNCTTSNEMFAAHQSDDRAVDFKAPGAPIAGAVKITSPNGDINWYHPAWDCAYVGGSFVPHDPDDFPSNRLDLVSAMPGHQADSLFSISDNLQEVTADAFHAATENEARGMNVPR
jgi:hypothetical protein